MKLKKYIPTILFCIMGITGLCVLCYPLVCRYLAEQEQKKRIEEYREMVDGLEEEKCRELLDKAARYNERLWEKNINFENIDSFKGELEKEGLVYEKLLRVKEDAPMGYLVIDKLDVSLTIGYGTSEDSLQKGIAHLEGSSLPIGGKNTHSALFGHRGVATSKLLSDLDQMEVGDTFEIHVLNQVLKYEVDQIVVVTPEEVDELRIEEGKDYVTLVTCTPYAVNTHRLLVRGARVYE